MRWWIKILFGLLLAVKLTPSTAHQKAAKTSFEPTQEQSKDHLKKQVQTGEACLIDERAGKQIAFHFRWPIQLFALAKTGIKTLTKEPLTVVYQPAAKVPLQQVHQTLLFPFHSNT